MIYQLNYKKIIALLTVSLIFVAGFLWYRGQTTNKEIPKRADFVEIKLEWSRIYG